MWMPQSRRAHCGRSTRRYRAQVYQSAGSRRLTKPARKALHPCRLLPGDRARNPVAAGLYSVAERPDQPPSVFPAGEEPGG